MKRLHTSVLDADAYDALSKKYLIPFQVCCGDGSKGERPFLTCRFNEKDGRYRSPWTHVLHPKGNLNDETTLEEDKNDDVFRLFELSVNEVWDAYKNLYYGHDDAVGSVFLRDTSDQKGAGPFSGIFGICKKKIGCGTWQSVSVVHVEAAAGQQDDDEKVFLYKVETSVCLILDPETNDTNNDDDEDTRLATTDERMDFNVNLSASLSKEVTKELKIIPHMLLASHIENMGELIEANEMDLRSQLERVSIPKTVEMVDLLMKEKEKSFRPAVNPLMGMIMDSSVLKKKLEKQGAP